MTIVTETAAIQTAVEALDTLLAQVATQVAVLDSALLARRDAIHVEFAAAGVPAQVAVTEAANADRNLCRAYLRDAAEPLLRLIDPAHPRIEPFPLAVFTARLAKLQSAAMGRLPEAAV